MGGISFNNFKLFFQFCIWDNLQVLLNSSSTVLLWAYNFVIWGHLHGKPREMLWFFVFITLPFSGGHKSLSHYPSEKGSKLEPWVQWLRVWLLQGYKHWAVLDVIKYSTNDQKTRKMVCYFFLKFICGSGPVAYWKTYLQLHPLSSLSEKCSIRKENVPRYQSEQFFSPKKKSSQV